MRKIGLIFGYHVCKIVFALICLTGVTFTSCSDEDVDTTDSNKGVAVSFTVSNAQSQAKSLARRDLPLSRAAFSDGLSILGLSPKDLCSQKLPAHGNAAAHDLCLIETTVAGVPDIVKPAKQTRANVVEYIYDNFSSFGFRSAAEADVSGSLSTMPWFHNQETYYNGVLATPIWWYILQPYGKFYGVYPKVASDYAKLTVSPSNYTGTPYVDFEDELDVKKQKDLLTACSGVVHYIGNNIAPTTNLAFRHALTAVQFKVGQNLSYNRQITKVEIIGAKSKGRYTLAKDENGTDAGWSDLSSPATFTLGGDGSVNVSTARDVNAVIMGNNGDNFTFYMIPQPLTGLVSVKIYFDNSPTPAITANLKGTWKPGTTKTYALSQNTSVWNYVLNVTSPTPADFDQNTSQDYKIRSYREDKVSHAQQQVKWKIVGYDNNNDGNYSMSEKPEWLTSLSQLQGDGSIWWDESGHASLKTDIIDKLAERNKTFKDATPLGTATAPYDLSTKGGTVNRSTANCYLISAPGHYKLPLVYGNAITNGNNNPHAYQTSVTGSDVLQHFKDHAGINITDPWITQSNGGVNIPDGAKIVWADESGLVKNLSLTGSGTNAFVNFEVPVDKIKNGNAVIAVTKGGTVVWSWQLWFAPQSALETIPCTNKTNFVYKFIKETLGFKYTQWSASTYTSPRSVKVKVEQQVADIDGSKQVGYITITQNDGSKRTGYATHYQWGRKDALPGIDAVPEGSFVKAGGSVSDIGTAIQHPEKFYPTGIYQYVNLWSMDNTRRDYNDDPVVKTVYDPCPAGFKVPAGNAFTGFLKADNSINAKGGWSFGYDFYNKINNPDATIYFPAIGWRWWSSDGKLGGIGDGARYWGATNLGGTGTCLICDNHNVLPQHWGHSLSYGSGVRPVAE